MKGFKVVHYIRLNSIVTDAKTVTLPLDSGFGHQGLLLVSTIKHKLHVYSLDTFEIIKVDDVQSTISTIHVIQNLTEKNSNSLFVAVCGQSLGKTTNVRIRKTK